MRKPIFDGNNLHGVCGLRDGAPKIAPFGEIKFEEKIIKMESSSSHSLFVSESNEVYAMG